MTISLKSSLTLVVAAVFLLTGIPAALAVESSPTSKARVQKRIEKQQEKREEIVQRKSEKLEKHCDAIQTGFTNIITKINSRIEKQKAEGWDTTTASQNVASAQTALDSAVSLCKQAVEKFDSVPADTWATQKDTIQQARSLAKQARDQFFTARRSVVAAIHALNVTRKENKDNKEGGI